MLAVIDLEELPVTDSIDFLRERMLAGPVPLELEPHRGADLVVRGRSADLGGIHVLCTKAKGGDILRTRRLVAQDRRPSLMVSVMDLGVTTVVRGDSAVQFRRGDIALYATDESYRIAFTPGAERLTFQIPFDRLNLAPDLVRSQLRTAIRPSTPVAAAVSGFLRDSARSAPHASPADLTALENPTIELIRLLLTRTVADTAPGREATVQSLATRIVHYVNSRIGDPDLTARSIADAFSISERYVYLILARRGIDLGDLIREHRMERAIRMLGDAADRRTLAEIAHLCGYSDHSHFTRAFRGRFGASPSEWRRRVRAGQPEA